MAAVKFEELAVGDKFIDVSVDHIAAVFQKKSGTSGYALRGSENGELVIGSKSDTLSLSKKALVIKL